MPVMDGSKVEGRKFDLIPTGEYKAVVEKVHERTSNQTGVPQWGVQWRIIDGEHTDSKVFDNLTWSDKAYWRIKWVLSELGVYQDGPVNWTPEHIIGKQCWVAVITTLVNGKEVNAIKSFKKMEQGDKKDDDLPF